MLITTLLFIIFGTSSSCKKTSDVPGPNEVFIEGNAFNPRTITVTANTTITWTNKDGIAHTVTSTTGLFDSSTINANGIFTHTFANAGTYNYFCIIHPNMTASVVVN